jgi:anti-sigma factor RsiW
MKCAALESLIALYVEGDLPVSGLRRVEAHLHSCTACNALAEDLRESQSMFKTLRAGTVNSSDLADVRDRVLSEVGDLEPAPGWVVTMHRLFFAGLRRRNAIAGVLLAALVTGSVWYSQWHVVGERKSDSPVVVARLELPPSALVSDAIVPPANSELVVKRLPPVQVFEALPVEEPEVQLIDEPVAPESQVSQIPMKFVTDDPDIIIYWLPSDKGD